VRLSSITREMRENVANLILDQMSIVMRARMRDLPAALSRLLTT
jgi:hypothetical protein